MARGGTESAAAMSAAALFRDGSLIKRLNSGQVRPIGPAGRRRTGSLRGRSDARGRGPGAPSRAETFVGCLTESPSAARGADGAWRYAPSATTAALFFSLSSVLCFRLRDICRITWKSTRFVSLSTFGVGPITSAGVLPKG